ncbi:unnamed protein product [Dibothriocephalus latus]|uniref:Uncharacterized protein n=1 Tax=Dibothriocephalus latus TaxID=60516 RepID=A0A3P7QPU2_DIBLA|nr:unnamed protein product [Dibothriocephalus latus]
MAADAVAARLGVVHNDLRLRRLPCRAKNITYAHVKELQREFSSFRVFDSLADFELIRSSERKQLEQIANTEGQTVFESKSGRLFFGAFFFLCPILLSESTPLSPSPPHAALSRQARFREEKAARSRYQEPYLTAVSDSYSHPSSETESDSSRTRIRNVKLLKLLLQPSCVPPFATTF